MNLTILIISASFITVLILFSYKKYNKFIKASIQAAIPFCAIFILYGINVYFKTDSKYWIEQGIYFEMLAFYLNSLLILISREENEDKAKNVELITTIKDLTTSLKKVDNYDSSIKSKAVISEIFDELNTKIEKLKEKLSELINLFK